MALTPAQMAKLRGQRDDVQQRLLSGNRKYLYLWGKNAVIKPGEVLVGRLGPRWDYLQQFILQNNKVVPNPEYDADLSVLIYQPIIEHWFPDRTNVGKRRKCTCRKLLGAAYRCPLCEVREALASGTEEERKAADDLEANELFLFNFIERGKELSAAGVPDWRILVAPPTIFTSVIDFMTGGKNEKFSRGEIFDPVKGYDISITRPDKQGIPYKVDCDPAVSRLYPVEKAATWTKPKHWASLLHDLSAEAEVESFEALYQYYYGELPDPSYYNSDEEAAAAAGEGPSQIDVSSGEFLPEQLDGQPGLGEGEPGADFPPAGDLSTPEDAAGFASPGEEPPPVAAPPVAAPPAAARRPPVAAPPVAARPAPPKPPVAATRPPARPAPAPQRAAPPARPAGPARRR